MKKRFSILSMVVAITSLIIYGCATAPGTSTYTNNTVCSNYSNGNINKMPYGLIKDMVKNYKDIQLKEINDSGLTGSGDAKAIWFDLETLKKFIYHIEHTAKSKDNNIKSSDLGIRIYYATYPTEVEWDNYNSFLAPFRNDSKTRKYENKHTLVMIPTIKGEKESFDFNPEDHGTYTLGFNGPNENPYQEGSNIPVFGLTMDPSSIAAQNHGGLFPPQNINELTFQ